MVRPGITGWAQVNGGNLVTPREKDELDEWYIRNASFWLDWQIIFMTILFLFRGERRSEQALADARSIRNEERDDLQDFPDCKTLFLAMQRIIFLNRFFFPDHSATSQILSDLAFHLASSGREVHVVASRQRYDDPLARLPRNRNS